MRSGLDAWKLCVIKLNPKIIRWTCLSDGSSKSCRDLAEMSLRKFEVGKKPTSRLEVTEMGVGRDIAPIACKRVVAIVSRPGIQPHFRKTELR
jgi:hypothetical protein